MKQIKLEKTNWTFVVSGVLLVAIIAFWKSYFQVFFTSEGFVHFHFFMAIVWFAMLLIQPLLIRSGKLDLHRLLGKLSYLIAGLVVVSIILLAHHRISTSPPEYYAFRTYLLYLQLSLAFIFSITYGGAIYFRRNRSIHARLMMATIISFFDPIIARLIMRFFPYLEYYTQWITLGVILFSLGLLSANDREDQKVKWVFPSLLFGYTILWIPMLAGVTEFELWQSFSGWFAHLEF